MTMKAERCILILAIAAVATWGISRLCPAPQAKVLTIAGYQVRTEIICADEMPPGELERVAPIIREIRLVVSMVEDAEARVEAGELPPFPKWEERVR